MRVPVRSRVLAQRKGYVMGRVKLESFEATLELEDLPIYLTEVRCRWRPDGDEVFQEWVVFMQTTSKDISLGLSRLSLETRATLAEIFVRRGRTKEPRDRCFIVGVTVSPNEKRHLLCSVLVEEKKKLIFVHLSTR